MSEGGKSSEKIYGVPPLLDMMGAMKDSEAFWKREQQRYYGCSIQGHAKREFVVGDRVRVVGPIRGGADNCRGREGHIIDPKSKREDSKDYTIEFTDHGWQDDYPPESLELVESKPSEKRRPTVGDTVRILGCRGNPLTDKGDLRVVTEDDGSNISFQLGIINGCEIWMREEDVELV